MRVSRYKLLPLLASLLLVSLGIAGCGEAPGTSNTGSSSSAGAMKLNVGQISDSIAFFPFYVAEQQGYFKDEGLTLGDRPRLGTGAKLAAALSAGSIDIAGGVITDAFNLARVNSAVKLIGSLVNGYYVDVTASKRFEQAAHVTKESTLAAKVKALRGKKIGITGPGSGTEALVIYLFKQQGMDAKRDAELVNLGSNNSAALAALRTGQVDALAFFSPVGQAAEVEGIGDILISPVRGDIPAMAGATHGVIFTRQSVIDTKPKAVQAFVRAVARAEKRIHDQPEQARALLKSYLKNLDPRTASAVLTDLKPALPQTPEITQQGYAVAAHFHEQAGLIKQAPAYNDLVDSKIINGALNG
jgi:ABC-type nitrate/sulfonate/bicarbonate transport system substrate-binding protein